MTRIARIRGFQFEIELEERPDSERPPSRPYADAEVEGEEVSGVRPMLALRPLLKPIAKASRLAEVIPLFRKAAG